MNYLKWRCFCPFFLVASSMSSPSIKIWGHAWLLPLTHILDQNLISSWFHLSICYLHSYSSFLHTVVRMIYINAGMIFSLSSLKLFKCLFIIYRKCLKFLNRVQSFLTSPSSTSASLCLGFCPSNSKLLDFSEMYHATILFFTFISSFNSAWNSSSAVSPSLHPQAQTLPLPKCLYSFDSCSLDHQWMRCSHALKKLTLHILTSLFLPFSFVGWDTVGCLPSFLLL